MSIPTANQNRLKDESVLSTDKLQITCYIQKGKIIKLDSLVALTNDKSRNDVIEKAIDFYFGNVTSQLSQDYLCGVIGTKIEGVVGTLGNRLASMSFKNAVELDILTRLVANVVNVTPTTFSKLRKASVDTVKRTNGKISLLDAAKESIEDDTQDI